MLPPEMKCGSGMPWWHRVRAWQKAGIWRELHRVLLDKLRGANKLDFARVIADGSSVRAVHGGKNGTEPNLSPDGGQQAPSPR